MVQCGYFVISQNYKKAGSYQMSPRWKWQLPEYVTKGVDLRRRVVWRDRGRCQECGTSRRPLHVYHIVSLSRGGSDEPSKLMTLCSECHSQYHSPMGGGGRSRWVPIRRPTVHPQLGVTSPELRAYAERRGLTGTPYSFEGLDAARKSPHGAFPPTSVSNKHPGRRNRGRTPLKFLCVAMLLMLNAVAWGSVLMFLVYWAVGNVTLQ